MTMSVAARTGNIEMASVPALVGFVPLLVSFALGFGGIPAMADPSTERAVDQARTAIQQHHLTERPLECLVLVPASGTSPDVRTVDVREKHDSSCGGDPATSPRLFSVEVNLRTGALSSDARSPTGEMEPLRPKAVTPR